MKAPSPLLGFNNNVRHKGRVFHIQTEDSGIRHPHIITHLFADGGRILKTTKTSYAEHIGHEALTETVRAMMQEQHKAMFIALRDGKFDHVFDESSSSGPQSSRGAARTGPLTPVTASPATAPSAPVAVAKPAAPQPPITDARAHVDTVPVHAGAAAAARADAAESNIRTQTPRGTPRPRLELDQATFQTRPASPAPAAPDRAAPARQTPPPRRIHSEQSIDLDLDALERAAAEAHTPVFQQIQDLPPPPAAVLGKRNSTGSYSVRPSRPAPPPLPAAARPPPTPPPARKPISVTPPPARYAPSRPAAIFATTRPPEGASIFGEDLISEKSLDEVILSYLAEDLDSPGEKK